MDSIDPKTLEKIKKCLALAGSDNPHEAAAAMRQATALMNKNGVTASHITMSEIGESKTKSATMSRDKPAQWEVCLAGMVGKTFGCKMMVSRLLYEDIRAHANTGEYIFVGLKQQAEIAAYTASVLIRKCKKARSNFISEKMGGLSKIGRGVKTKMTRMGDAFAEGWVISIAQLVTEFAVTPAIAEAIDQHIGKESKGVMAQVRGVERGSLDDLDLLAVKAGINAAAGESLYRPMSKNDDALALEHSS